MTITFSLRLNIPDDFPPITWSSTIVQFLRLLFSLNGKAVSRFMLIFVVHNLLSELQHEIVSVVFDYIIVEIPPSIVNICPVIHDDCSLKRKEAMFAISSGLPIFLRG